ncbi:MAG: methionyl-tRNA formyltransferase [Desulfitobacterium sp.]
MRLVFMGTPDFAVPTLQALVAHGHEVVGVFTQPDRPSGRGKALKPSPVKVVAQELGLTVYQPQKVKNPESLQLLRELAPEVIIVVAYGQILSKEILDLPPFGCINVHASLLPDWRGAAPIHWAILAGDQRTGVTTMQMDVGLDTGDMLLKVESPIGEDATTGELHDNLAHKGAELLVTTLEQLQMGELQSIPQSGPTRYASLLTREHEKIDWTRSAQEIHNQIRGLHPWPGAYTTFREETVKVRTSRKASQELAKESFLKAPKPGEVVNNTQEGLLIQTGEGLILVTEVQPAGKKTMPARDFFLGRHAQVGEGFGEGWIEHE